jgi:tetratricopeptide (TPR) repeat protein
LSNALEYLENAARCFERAGFPEEAARCHARAGAPDRAAPLYEALATAGSLADAARCYRAAGQPAAAARCWDRLGLPERAAQDWLAADDALNAGWALLRAGQQTHRSRSLFAVAHRAGPLRALRRELGLVVVTIRLGGQPGRLVSLLASAERRLDAPDAAHERADLERDAVFAADLIGRPDLAAEIFAAAHRGGVPGAAARWSAWAQDRGAGPPGQAGGP